MRVFTFFLKTDTFKKKLELCQFFHKEYFYSFGSKISYFCKSMCECVLFKDNGSTGWTSNLRSWTSYTASFSNRHLQQSKICKTPIFQSILRARTMNKLVSKNPFDFLLFGEEWPSGLWCVFCCFPDYEWPMPGNQIHHSVPTTIQGTPILVGKVYTW